MNALIRPIQPDDAEAFAKLFTLLLNETKFLLWEVGERPFDAAFWSARIDDTLIDNSSVFLVAEQEGELVGFSRAMGEMPRRRQHAALIVVAIRQASVGQGIGTQFFKVMEEWAVQKGLHRLELTVVAHNQRAIALYQKMGFVIEGTLRHNLQIEGHYVDEFAMAKLI